MILPGRTMILVLNILHVLPTDKFSGAEKVAGQICLNIDKEKFNTFIICNGGSLMEKYKREGLKTARFNVNKINIPNLIGFKKFCIDNKIDIVHAHGFRASFFALLAGKLFLKRLKIISHVHECSEWLMRNTYVRRVDRLIRNSFSVNIMCGKKVCEHYLEYGSYIDKSKIIILSNAMDMADISSIDTHDARIKQGDEFVFGFIGCLAYRKGLVPFFNRILEKREVLQGAKIVLVGDGDQGEELKKVVHENGLTDSIMFLGHQEDIYKYLVQFDLFILPSIVEGLPMVVLEAMSVGKPVLAFNVGSMAEALKDKETGFLVEPGDYATFFNIMDRAKSESAKLEELGQKAKALVENEFSINRYMSSIENIYTGILKK